MAKKFLTGLTLVNLDSDPLVGSEGELYFNTSASVAKIYKAGAWTELGAGGATGITISESAPSSPSVGDLWYQASTGSFSVWDGEYWVEINSVITVGVAISETAPPYPKLGDLWYQASSGELALYDGTYWVETNGTVSLGQEDVQDYVAPLFTHSNHTNITATYDDLNNEILLSAGAGYTNEEAVDAVASALLNASANSNVVVTYDDVNNAINLNTSGSITNIDSIVYPDYITFDTTPETSSTTPGTLYWDSGDGLPKTILNANVELGIGQESVALVKNGTLSSIPKASVIYINGAQGQRPTIALADADTEPTSSKTFGFTAETIASGAEGFVVTEGILRGVNTNGLTEGGALWLSSTAGGYTQTMPPAPANSVFLGYVVKAHASAGEIFIKVQNGYELNELHNVSINGASDNQALVYNSSASIWYNESIVNSISGTENEIEVSASVGNITIGLPNSPTLTTPNIGAATGTSLTTTGSVVSHITILTPTFTSNEYTLVIGDDGDLLMLDNGSTDGTVYVPTDATYNFTIGTQINLVQKGAGQITIQATTPGTTTINYTPGNKLRAQWSGATLIKTAANEWLLMGDLEL